MRSRAAGEASGSSPTQTASASSGGSNSTAVEARGLAVTYPSGEHALQSVDLTVARGEVVALVGANGSGKSTLLRAFVGIVKPTAGSLSVSRCDVRTAGTRELRELRRRTGFVLQDLSLVDRLSAFDNVQHGALGRSGLRGWLPPLTRASDRVEAMRCLDRVGMASFATRRVDRLSGGQRQRVCMARMLMQQPTLVLADEPVASLDPAAGREAMGLLRDVARNDGLTVIVALHQPELAAAYADRIVGLERGRISLDRRASGCDAAALEHLYAPSAA